MNIKNQQIKEAIKYSLYLQREINRQAEFFENRSLVKKYKENELVSSIFKEIIASNNLVELNINLRLIRNKEMVRIALRDLLGLAKVVETVRDLSDLAEGIVSGALEWHYQQESTKFGTPIGAESNQPQKMLVIGMGKLGGKELNFSSDIDLIFAYPEKGYAVNLSGKETSNSQFFIRLGQALNKSLTECTEDGFVYRVDMRLRPFGNTGPLAVSFNELENYYATHGRAWERYALVKARIIAGDITKGQQLFEILRPFVYRKYIDFSSIDSLRDLKQMIHVEVVKKEMFNNLKLGRGGIREIEFIVQSFQLVNGGRDKLLQSTSLLKTLHYCIDKKYLSVQQVAGLEEAYLFLRKVENRLQQWDDQQTHDLPSTDEQQHLLSLSMGFIDYKQFILTLDTYRDFVQQQFDLIFLESDKKENLLYEKQNISTVFLEKYGFVDSQQIITTIDGFKNLAIYRRASKESVERFEQVLPKVIVEISTIENKLETLQRMLLLFENILQRSVYLVLLIENKSAIENLILLCSMSQWLTEMLVKNPALFDQLLDGDILFEPLDKAQLYQEAMQICTATLADDEQFMNKIREWKKSQVFKVAASDVTGHLPIMKVSDYLTWVAEASLNAVAEYSWQFMLSKNGQPAAIKNQQRPLLILGYGKLGGVELGYDSDLDVVFLYHGLKMSDKTTGLNGKKKLDNTIFFTRMTQKIISLMTTIMPTGKLYEIDTRLRPNGASGLVISDFESFMNYQQNKAWLWEHQALVRARAVVTDEQGENKFNQFKHKFIQQKQDLVRLKQQVVDMRLKMRESLDKSNESFFDLKQGEGGIVDIEFIVQYLVLGYANKYPDLAKHSDNISLLEIIKQLNFLEFKQISSSKIKQIEIIYCQYRKFYHRLSLQNINSKINYKKVISKRKIVIDIWQKILIQTE